MLTAKERKKRNLRLINDVSIFPQGRFSTMKKTITNFCLITLALACFLLLPVCAIAIPTLGVAPGAPGSGGVY